MPHACLAAVAVAMALTACAPKANRAPTPAHTGEGRDASAAETGASLARDADGAKRAALDAELRAAPKDYRCGYVDEEDKTVIARRFDDADNFASGLAAVRENGKRGFIDATGTYVIKPTFDEAKSFHEGLAAACIDGKGWGFVGPKGAWVVAPTLASADSFSEGVAVVRDDPAGSRTCDGREDNYTPAGSECESSGDIDDEGPGAYFLVDRTGRRVNDHGYHCITRLSDGLAAVRWKDQWGYIDRTGRPIISPRFMRAKPFGEGLAAVRLAQRAGASRQGGQEDVTADELGEWDLINKQGKIVVRLARLRAREMGVFSEGLISIEGLSRRAVVASAVGRGAVARWVKGKGRGRRAGDQEDGADDPDAGEAINWGGYVDKKGALRLALPYCGFDDANLGTRSLREMSGGVARAIMQSPATVVPFRCSEALAHDVVMFADRKVGYVRPPLSFLARQSSERLIPKCRGDAPQTAVGGFTWE